LSAYLGFFYLFLLTDRSEKFLYVVILRVSFIRAFHPAIVSAAKNNKGILICLPTLHAWAAFVSVDLSRKLTSRAEPGRTLPKSLPEEES
jgi:hypothetical protein